MRGCLCLQLPELVGTSTGLWWLGDLSITLLPGRREAPSTCPRTRTLVRPSGCLEKLGVPWGDTPTSPPPSLSRNRAQEPLASWSCHHRLSQTVINRVAKTTEMDSLAVRGTRIQTSRCRQGRAPSGGCRGGPPHPIQLLGAPCIPFTGAACWAQRTLGTPPPAQAPESNQERLVERCIGKRSREAATCGNQSCGHRYLALLGTPAGVGDGGANSQ